MLADRARILLSYLTNGIVAMLLIDQLQTAQHLHGAGQNYAMC